MYKIFTSIRIINLLGYIQSRIRNKLQQMGSKSELKANDILEDTTCINTLQK